MSKKFIELTLRSGKKVLVNIDHIIHVEQDEHEGCVCVYIDAPDCVGKHVQDSYSDIRKMLLGITLDKDVEIER